MTGGAVAPDAPRSGTDLTRVALEADGRELVVTFETDGDVPMQDAGLNVDGEVDIIQWVVWTMRGEEVRYQLRVALDGDRWETTFDAGDQRILVTDERPEIRGNKLRVRYDLDLLPNLGEEFVWTALSVYDDPGYQDLCPDRVPASLEDGQLSFPDR